MRGRFGLPASVLVSAALGASLNPLNSTMVAVALPALSAEFSASPSSVTLMVVTGYLVATLVSQVPAGAVADRVGYARALTLGRWLLLAGAAAGAVAPALWVVVVARLVMAFGGSLTIPTAMALVRVAVPDARRARAFGTLGAVLGSAAAIGPALGAFMTSHFGWRSLFLINIPMLAASWLVQPRVPEPPGHQPHPFDWPGSVLIGATLVLLTFSTRTAAPLAWGLAAAGVLAAGLLLWHERRVPAPVLRLSLFSERVFVAGAGIIATQNLGMYSLLLIVPFLFGGGTTADPQLGLAIIAMTATMAAMSPVGGRLAERIGAHSVVLIGGLAGAAGIVALTRLPATASAFEVGLRLLWVGVGIGLSSGPAQALALDVAPRAQSGVASATMSMMRYLGAVVGTVIIGWALAPTVPRRQGALWMFAAAFFISAVLGLMLRSRHHRSSIDAPTGAEPSLTSGAGR